MLTKWLLGKEQNIRSSGVFWNAVGGALNAGQAAVILIFISHKCGLVTAGIVTIGYAVANLIMSIGKYGVRNYQVTDTAEQFSFSDYFFARLISFAAVIVITFLYILYCVSAEDSSGEKAILLLEIILLKLVDVIEDVYLGRYQQKGRLDIGARIMSLRMAVVTALICLLVSLGAAISYVFPAAAILSVLLDVICISATRREADIRVGKYEKKKVLLLLKLCFSLCIGTTLSIYIGNVPKYMINRYMDETTQAIFGYIMMPVFVVMLLSTFIYQPAVKGLGDLWERRDIRKFKRNVRKQCLIVTAMAVVITVLCLWIGLPILSVLYDTDLTVFQKEFVILLLGGAFYALAYYLNVPITTIRCQNFIAYGYILAAILSTVLGKRMILYGGMMGAAILYLGINILLTVFYALVLSVGIARKSDMQRNEDQTRYSPEN